MCGANGTLTLEYERLRSPRRSLILCHNTHLSLAPLVGCARSELGEELDVNTST